MSQPVASCRVRSFHCYITVTSFLIHSFFPFVHLEWMCPCQPQTSTSKCNCPTTRNLTIACRTSNRLVWPTQPPKNSKSPSELSLFQLNFLQDSTRASSDVYANIQQSSKSDYRLSRANGSFKPNEFDVTRLWKQYSISGIIDTGYTLTVSYFLFNSTTPYVGVEALVKMEFNNNFSAPTVHTSRHSIPAIQGHLNTLAGSRQLRLRSWRSSISLHTESTTFSTAQLPYNHFLRS